MTEPYLATQKRCLLVAPLSFYSFHQTLSEGLRLRGYSVDVLNEEFPQNGVGKVLGKIALPILRKLTLIEFKLQLDKREPYDLVLIVKGRGLSPKALAYLRTKAHRIVGYNFDSFQFNPSPLDWYHLADRYATFDIKDASERGIPLVHLFSAVSTGGLVERPFDVSVIQKIHSDRLVYVDLLLRALPVGTRSFVFLYESSLLTFCLGLLRYPRLYAKLWKYISFKPLGYAQAMAALGQSLVTFDYAHPLQSGITVRCFEAQSLGVGVLTNNKAAVDSGLFSSGSIAYFSKDADLTAVAALVAQLSQRISELRCRSLDGFLDDLLSEAAPSVCSALFLTENIK